MISNCEAVQDLLIPYINRQLSPQENSDIITHIAKCPKCRKEVTELILLQKQMSNIIVDVPKKLYKTAFSKLEQSIEFSNTSYDVFKTISYVVLLCKKTINFAWQVI